MMINHHHSPIVLASGSAIRHQLLCDAGIQARVMPASINERLISKKDPLNAQHLAEQKALTISKKHPHVWVIGADQICHLKGRVFHKTRTLDDAIQTLTHLQGTTHQLITAVCLANNGHIRWSHQDTIHMRMRPLTIHDIHHYVALDAPLHSAGGYYYEQNGHALFDSVSHPSTSIQGLPMAPLIQALRDEGVIDEKSPP